MATALPLSIDREITVWQLREATPSRFRAVQSPKWHKATWQTRATWILLVVVALAWTLFTFGAVNLLGETLRRLLVLGGHRVLWRETLVAVAVLIPWLGTVVWVATRPWMVDVSPQRVRVGWRHIPAGRVRAVMLRRHAWQTEGHASGNPLTDWGRSHGRRSLITMRLDDGREYLLLFTDQPRQHGRMRVWAQRIAEVLNVPCEEHPAD
nr:hypothetical protein [Ardenticatena sp.]